MPPSTLGLNEDILLLGELLLQRGTVCNPTFPSIIHPHLLALAHCMIGKVHTRYLDYETAFGFYHEALTLHDREVYRETLRTAQEAATSHNNNLNVQNSGPTAAFAGLRPRVPEGLRVG